MTYTTGRVARAAPRNPLFISLRLLRQKWEKGMGGGGGGGIEGKLILAIFYCNSFSSLTHRVSSYLPFDVHYEIPFLKRTV